MHTVFVLGAGASRTAGAPLMHDFIDKASLRAAVETDSRFKEAFTRLFAAITDLQGVHAKAFLDTENIEALFGAVEMGELIGKFGRMSPESITALREALILAIVRTLDMSIHFPTTERRILAPPAYAELADLIRKIRSEARSIPHTFGILTFNYDIAIDYALYSSGLPYSYGLAEEPISLDGSVPLLKLHGSVNWGVCQRCQEPVPLTFDKVSHPHLWDSRASVLFDLGSKIHLVEHCSAPASGPLLVPPTWNKSTHHKRLQNVWRHAAAQLGAAENVFVIGYSLPASDSFFRYLLALGSQSDTRLRRFWVVNPDADGTVQTRFNDIIGRGIAPKVRFLDSGSPCRGDFRESLPIIERALNELD